MSTDGIAIALRLCDADHSVQISIGQRSTLATVCLRKILKVVADVFFTKSTTGKVKKPAFKSLRSKVASCITCSQTVRVPVSRNYVKSKLNVLTTIKNTLIYNYSHFYFPNAYVGF